MNTYGEELNDLNLIVPSGEYKGYKVVFDLQFIDGGNSLTAEQRAKESKYHNNSIGNTIRKGNEYTNRNLNFTEKEMEDGRIITTGGVTDKKKNIVMNVSKDTKQNRMHEIFHTFGFEYPKGEGGKKGIMHYPPRTPTKEDALELSTTPFLPTQK